MQLAFGTTGLQSSKFALFQQLSKTKPSACILKNVAWRPSRQEPCPSATWRALHSLRLAYSYEWADWCHLPAGEYWGTGVVVIRVSVWQPLL